MMLCLTILFSLVLGAASKALATIATQPLIVAKVGLQSKPPASRKGKPFKSFIEVMQFIIEDEGLLGLFKGIGPQITKGILVQGILMMAKERYVRTASILRDYAFTNTSLYRVELMFILFFRYIKSLRAARLERLASAAASRAPELAAKTASIVSPK